MSSSNLPSYLRSRLREALTICTTHSGDLKTLWRAIGSLIYPAFCLHCSEKLASPQLLICPPCATTIEWLHQKTCCVYCGSPLLEKRCLTCCQRKTFLQPHASLFTPFGPIADIWSFFCTRLDDSLAKLWAALITVKLAQLPWPLPDVIVPIPASRVETWRHCDQKSVLIASALGRLFCLPVRSVLARTAEDQIRAKKKSASLCDQKVLLVAAEVVASDQLFKARLCVKALFPKTVYSLAVIDRRAQALGGERLRFNILPR